MKKFILFLLTLSLFFSFNTFMTSADDSSGVKRYTVLVLDTSGTANFIGRSGETIYTADTAIDYVKKAAVKFTEDVLKASGDNYVAVISYKNIAQKIVDFTNDYEYVKSSINSLYSDSKTRDISAGLSMAYDLILNISDDSAIKNVVLVTTGMTNDGTYSYSGHYNSSTIGSSWKRQDNNVSLYAYANNAYSVAESVKEKANLYTLGIFQTMSNIPEEGKGIAEFFRLTTFDLASSEEYFYDIESPDDIEFKFGEIADDITTKDSDGDGLPDVWEINGIDIDNDGVIDLHIEKMGANPYKPDIFIEVDWMVEPNQKTLFIETQQETSLAPTQEAMRIVYESFKKQGINLHIDAGPDSIDFVTGKKWGNLSSGNEIPYQKNFSLGDKYENWNDAVNNNFDVKVRGNVFRHCMFINKYNNCSSSGIAVSIPGQYFIVANQEWLRKTGDIGIAGTFMHELGHTLGLSHGGRDEEGELNHDRYKPNYLSIMNYLFQTSGLVGTNEVNYSEYKLPYLDEKSLDEKSGIDPHGVTAGTGLGTKISCGSFWGYDKEVTPVSKTSVDYNNLFGIDKNLVKADLNNDGKKTLLTSSTDWNCIEYKAGDIGTEKQIIHIAGLEPPDAEEKYTLEEVDLEERLKNGLLANEGSGSIEHIGPYTLLDGVIQQKTIIRVSNLSTKEAKFELIIEESDIIDGFSKEITVEGSTTKISYIDVEIPIKNNPKAGEYSTKVILRDAEQTDKVIEAKTEVYAPTDEELNELRQLLLSDEDSIPEHIKNSYLETIKTEAKTSDSKNLFTYLIESIKNFFINILTLINNFFSSFLGFFI